MKNLLLIPGFLCIFAFNVKSQTWALHQHRDNIAFRDIKFINNNIGFAFGDSSANGTFITSAILKTTDGGQNWSIYVLSNSNYHIEKSFFLNATEGFASGRSGGSNTGLFLKTVDGGITWTNASTFSEKLLNVCFLNSTTGWVMGKNGLLSKTTDGGLSWNPQGSFNEDIFSMRFFNSTQGVMVCGGAEIYVTDDAGSSWNLVASNVNEDLISVAINGNNAWICGTAGTLIYSADAGQTWTTQTGTASTDLTDISFPDAANGYTVGLSGIINQTQNAGTLWQNQNSNCNYDITAIAVPDINHGWFCTDNGDIYSFSGSASVSESMIENYVPVIFPNPAINTINLSVPVYYPAISSIKIFDKMGKLCLQYNDFSKNQVSSISVESLSPGIYISEIIIANRKYNSKLVKSNTD